MEYINGVAPRDAAIVRRNDGEGRKAVNEIAVTFYGFWKPDR